MNKLAILLIDFYKQFLAVGIKSILGAPDVCRFSEHCDDYAKRIILEKGIFKGTYLSFARLLKCQPFYKNNLV